MLARNSDAITSHAAADACNAIGSEGYVPLEMGRKFVGVELKRSYFDQAVRNLSSAAQAKTEDLFAEQDAA